MSSAGVLVSNYCLDGFQGLGVEGVTGEVVVGKVSFYGFKVIHTLGDDSGSVPGAAELEVVLDHIFQLLLQLDEVRG
jgi:hypothetical protein